MRRDLWLRNVEIALLAPASLVMAPMAVFAALGMGFALVQQTFLIAIVMLFMLLIAFLAGILGLACVWASLVVPAHKFVHSRSIRIGLACGILLGIADALYWLSTLRAQLNNLGPSGWGVWLLMVAGPIIVGIHQFVRLMRLQERPTEARMG